MIKLSGAYQMPYKNLFAEPKIEVKTAASNVAEETLSVLDRISRVTVAIFTSLGEAALSTASQLGMSFYRRVLGFDGERVHLEASIYGNALKIVFWLMGTGFFFVVSVGRQFQEKIFPNLEAGSTSAAQVTYASKEIDVAHLHIQKTSIDVSGVPDSIKLDDLMKIYDEINFSSPDNPGHMKESTRKEGSYTYTKEELRESLEKFVRYTKTRTAFLGTPPAYDTVKLESFYKQIEDAVRFSIHKVNEDLAAFKAINSPNGEDPSTYSEEVKKKFNGLLEDRSRVAIDLAIAGKHCGARFMGDSMDTYFLAKGDSLGESQGGLQDVLLSILANKRKEIANRHIETYLVSIDPITGARSLDTHAKPAYLQAIGKIAGIPGSENIVEHLSSLSNAEQDKYLKLFFKEYTTDCIISALEEEIAKEKNLFLRTSIADAVVDHLNEFPNQEYEEKSLAKFREVESVMQQSNSSRSVLGSQVEDFIKLKEVLPSYVFNVENWDESVTDFFSQTEVKTWFLEKMPGKEMQVVVARRKEVQALLDRCKQQAELFKGASALSLQEIQEKAIEIEKVEKVLPLFPGSDPASLTRLVKSENLQDGVRELLQRERNFEFKGQLLEEMQSKGLSSELMEWVLVSQGIFVAQQIEVTL